MTLFLLLVRNKTFKAILKIRKMAFVTMALINNDNNGDNDNDDDDDDDDDDDG